LARSSDASNAVTSTALCNSYGLVLYSLLKFVQNPETFKRLLAACIR
jgi:hypothetical protein